MKKIIFLLSALVVLNSCGNTENQNTNNDKTNTNVDPVKKERVTVSLKNHLIGTYLGNLPCDNCLGIKTILTISGGNRASFRRREIGKKDGESFAFEGTWSPNADSTVITLSNDKNEKMYFTYANETFIPMENEKTVKDCGSFDCTLKKPQSVKIKAGDIKALQEKAQSKEEVKSTGTFEKATKK